MNKGRALIAVAAAALLLTLPFVLKYEVLATRMLVWALFALGFDILLGYGGLLSFGHAAFFGVSCYGAALANTLWGWPVVPAILFGAGVSMAASVVVGYLAIHRRGIYFSMVTLAFAQLFYFWATQWKSVTGAEDGVRGVRRGHLVPGVNLDNDVVFYYFALAVACAMGVFAWRVVRSPFGAALLALRENQTRAMSIGYDIKRLKMMAFVLSAFFAGVAGGVNVFLHRFAGLEGLHWSVSGEVIVMTVVGGIGTLVGPAFGGAIVIYFQDLLSDAAGWMLPVSLAVSLFGPDAAPRVKDALFQVARNWNFFMGILFVLCVLGFRRGIWGELERKLAQKGSSHA